MASKHWMRKPGEVYFPSFAGAGGVLPILLASERLDHFVDAALYQRIRAVYPEFVVSDTLVTMLHRLEHERSGWNELEYKNWLPLALEDVAVCLERYLPRQLRSGDQSSDLWIRAAFQSRAWAFRALKKWIVVPKPDTRDHLLRRIAAGVVQSISGNWDNLESAEPETAARAEPWHSRLVQALRVALSAALPSLLFWALQRTPIAVHPPVSDYVAVATFVWVALTVLAALDPLYKIKLEGLKHVTALLPVAGKKS
jgi:hypothetical protein